jgi:hypothetical protein
VQPAGKCRHSLDVGVVLGLADLPDAPRDVIGIDFDSREKPVGMLLEGALGDVEVRIADETGSHSAVIHLLKGYLDRIGTLGEVIGHLLEHVLRRELHLLALGVLSQ